MSAAFVKAWSQGGAVLGIDQVSEDFDDARFAGGDVFFGENAEER